MKSVFATAAAWVILAGSAPAADKFDAKKLVGTWTVTKASEGPFEGAVFVFKADGTMSVALNLKGKQLTAEGTYKLTGDQLTHAIAPKGVEAKEEVETVKKLTDDEMVSVDAKGRETVLKRKK